MSDYLHYTQRILTAVDEFDYYERLKPSALMQYFQDLATVHATHIGIGYEEMKEKNLCWVLSRLSARITVSPMLGDTVTVTTYPRKPHLVDAVRDYYVTDSTGKQIACGTSKWCVLDIKSRAIRRCSPLFAFDDGMYIPQEPFADGNPQLPSIKDAPTVAHNNVSITDLDRNLHMNNARYGDAIYNACTLDFLNAHSISAFDLNFLSELKAGESYDIRKRDAGDESYFEAVRADGLPVFRARIEWTDFIKQKG